MAYSRRFSRLGTLLERADNIVRCLDIGQAAADASDQFDMHDEATVRRRGGAGRPRTRAIAGEDGEGDAGANGGAGGRGRGKRAMPE
ncbi:hypothetical protein [Burkholderia territorii]|uniref:hypothetical protein n=1 Tax=Burkholderia territorii TaxID=1503055 RepID=UPI000755FCF9|nr:hypothetical protein [Burkholderia territorii]KVL06312.1 hypothetical protein WS94_08490 [Burkholderia territorii]